MTRSLSQSIAAQPRRIGGVSIRYAESESRNDDALLLSPWPESIYAFEPTWTRLAERMHLVAIDLPGFGQSEHRESLMSPRAMGEFVVRVADSFSLQQPHLVGMDIGCAAALFAAAFKPGRFRSLVVGSGGAAVPLQLGGRLKEWVEAPGVEAYRKIDGREIVAGAIELLDRYRLSDAAREDYLASYAGERFAQSMSYVRAYPQDLPKLGDLLPTIETPVQIIAGANDRAVPPVNAEFLHERLPKSRLDILDVGHFTWEDAADQFATMVTGWWSGGDAALRNQPREPEANRK